MKNLWEDLPASPCSAASDDTHMRPTRELRRKTSANSLAQVSSVSIDTLDMQPSQPAAKRARTVSVDPDQPAVIEFAEAKSNSDCDHGALVSKLNADKEARRKELMRRLQAIESQKVRLASRSPASIDDDIIVVEDKGSDPAPVEVKKGGRKRKTSSVPKRTSRRRAAAKTSATSVAQVIDVDAVRDPGLRRKKGARAGSANAKKGMPVAPKRISTRVRRPRAPNSLLTDNAESSKPVHMPACMSKCKRLQFCKKLVATMIKDSAAYPFSAPVGELWPEHSIPRYFEVITKPMDLRTVKKKLDTTAYLHATKGDYLPYRFDVELYAEDMRLIYRNAMVYNRVGDAIYNIAKSMRDDFNRTMVEQLPPPPSPEEIAACLSKKRSTVGRPRKDKSGDNGPRKQVADDPDIVCVSGNFAESRTVVEHDNFPELDIMSEKELKSRQRYLQDCRKPVIARQPLPKGSGYLSRAALLYEVEMTWEEKKRCTTAFDKVPPTKISALIAMIKKSSKAVEEEKAEEFEFDMDSLDNTAMRNIEAFLEQYVAGFKTVRSSTLGREFSSIQEVDDEIRAIRERLSTRKVERPSSPSTEPCKIISQPKSFFEQSEDMNDSSDSSSGEESDSDSDSSDDSDCDDE